MLEIDGALQDECGRIAQLIEWKKSGVCAWTGCAKRTNSWRYALCYKHTKKMSPSIRQHIWKIVDDVKGGNNAKSTTR